MSPKSVSVRLLESEHIAPGFVSPSPTWIDHCGQKYGKWTALHPTVWRTYIGDEYSGRWLLQCECGTKKVLPLKPLMWRLRSHPNTGCARCAAREKHARAREYRFPITWTTEQYERLKVFAP